MSMTNLNAPGKGHNNPPDEKEEAKQKLQAWLDVSREMGETAGSGAVSKLNWMQETVERAARGDIVPDYAEKGYNAFAAGMKKKSGIARAGSGKDAAVRISECRTMIRFGMLPNAKPTQVFSTVLRIVRDNADIKGEVDDKVLKIARLQLKHPDAPLTADEIEGELRRQLEASEKTEVEECILLRKALRRHIDKHGGNAHIKSALNSVESRIEQLGGDPKEKAKAERVKARAERQAAKKKTKRK